MKPNHLIFTLLAIALLILPVTANFDMRDNWTDLKFYSPYNVTNDTHSAYRIHTEPVNTTYYIEETAFLPIEWIFLLTAIAILFFVMLVLETKNAELVGIISAMIFYFLAYATQFIDYHTPFSQVIPVYVQQTQVYIISTGVIHEQYHFPWISGFYLMFGLVATVITIWLWLQALREKADGKKISWRDVI